jgi:deoxyribodipyrimidine photo-lyase
MVDPVRHGERFDPEGEWVRRWVPELVDVPTAHVHAPWRMSPAQANAIGFIPGRTYPEPVVDPRAARQRAVAPEGPRPGPSYGGP